MSRSSSSRNQRRAMTKSPKRLSYQRATKGAARRAAKTMQGKPRIKNYVITTKACMEIMDQYIASIITDYIEVKGCVGD